MTQAVCLISSSLIIINTISVLAGSHFTVSEMGNLSKANTKVVIISLLEKGDEKSHVLDTSECILNKSVSHLNICVNIKKTQHTHTRLPVEIGDDKDKRHYAYTSKCHLEHVKPKR